ncbi:pilus assembly protein [Polaromonas aquatica]|uniref:pilus assembly protein n=1 Tax=Polaromonas aquatica TaxID=332657 RepID=UPI003D64E450
MNTTHGISWFKKQTVYVWIRERFKFFLLFGSALLALQTHAVNFTPLPPYLSEIKGAPMVMLNLSRDHQLFYKAYNEYSDLDGDGAPETQYRHAYKYYGYFDNQRCYQYSTTNNRFFPTRQVASDGYCNYTGGSSEWSGNFMNWATMTRMDVVRRILYGGFRSTDDSIVSGTSLTVLERAHLPTDAHAFAKYYVGADISKLTPFNKAEITLCNASFSNTAAPSILVADGNYSLWNANERWQCYWSEDKAASNGNDPALTGLNAASSNPSRASKGLGTGYAAGSYTARVEVCKTGLTGGLTADEEARCKLYPLGNYKPIGLLQKYGERNEAAFGLMTGSFDKNISGGVLRKNVASFTDEVDIDDGQFKNFNGIVTALNKLKIYGYSYADGTYENTVGRCNFQQIGLVDGECSSWGNPLGEMYLESLRYLAGKTATAAYVASPATRDTSLGLTITAWSDPFATTTVAAFGDRLCRRSSVVNFNASVTSFDNDQWTGASSISGLSTTTVDTYTNQIGAAEGLFAAGKTWPIGRNGTNNNGYCSDKALTFTGVTSLANATGVCPEAPTQFGGYKMAGAALYAHTTPIRSDFTIPANNRRAFRVDTYGVALATGNPRIKVPVPGQPGKFVFISPAYRLDVGTGGGGTLVDFKVVTQTPTAGKYLINWEDSEQGGDYDQDVLGILEYSVVGTTISIKTYVAAEATGQPQGFGYAITGTNGKDGIHFHSGIEGFDYNDPRNITVTPATNVNGTGGCNNCQVAQTATTAAYSMVGVSGEELQDPLWYAAKYGGFDRDKTTTYTLGSVLPIDSWDLKKADGSTGTDGIPDNFFYAVDPAQLEKSLEQVFSTILKAGGAAPAATSARTDAGGFAYQSSHSIKPAGGGADADASGQFQRFSFQSNGLLSASPDWDAGAKLTIQNWDTGRRILSLNGTGTIPFRWTNLDAAQQTALRTNPQTGAVNNVATGQNRLNWLRGDNTNETAAGGLRARPATKLGAIINSTPWFVGPPSAGYTNSAYGGGYNTFRTNNTATNAVFVAANDGMLHAINGATGDELFAYVPRALYTTSATAPYSKLSAITAKDFALNSGTNSINVDGSVMAADMKVGGTWSTYLFGTLGRGGKGVYALNVTKPQNITEASTAVAKWEFTEATGDPDMGYIVGRPSSRSNGQPFQTGYMANGKWAAIYGNGYNSTSGKAALFILFADGPASAGTTTWTAGTHYIKIPTGTAGNGPDNGLGIPIAIDTDNNGAINVVYAGDLKGNVWKFDVSNSDPALWKVATTSNVPLYQASTTITGSTTAVVQPISTVVQPFPHPNGGYQLVFGTGKSLESTDYPMSVSFTNTIYGIYDRPGNTSTLTVGLTDLVHKSTTFSAPTRYIQNNTVNYTNKDGWYVNLPLPSEGIVFNLLAEDSNRVSIKSIAPDGTSDGCRVDSVSITMDLDPITGSPIPNAVDGAPAINGFLAAGTTSNNSFEIGRGGIYRKPTPPASTTACIPGSPNCVCNPAAATECVLCLDPATCNPPWAPKDANQCVFRKLSALGTGGVETTLRYGSCSDGRLTWREILRNR